MIDPKYFGVSFSSKQCRNLKIDHEDTLKFLIKTVGFRRFRLMSYWNEHEKIPGQYDFSGLDKQLAIITKSGGAISLCLGVRQPRWPESHWPSWALDLPPKERYEALYQFIIETIKRYRGNDNVLDWQLENEALNRSFGKNGDFNRNRLRHEMHLVRQLDPSRSVIMSTSNTWGIPVRTPRPDRFGFTLYQIQHEKGVYNKNKLPIWWWPMRAKFIALLTRRRSFIHELQTEPWGPKAIWEMTIEQQNKSMSLEQLASNIQLAISTKLYPVDLWGGEWWYWRHLQNDDAVWQTVRDNLTPSFTEASDDKSDEVY